MNEYIINQQDDGNKLLVRLSKDSTIPSMYELSFVRVTDHHPRSFQMFLTEDELMFLKMSLTV